MPDSAPVRTALVTGASAGIGQAIAEVFAKEGFDLVLTARRGDRLEALAADLRQRFGRRVATIVADLADPAAPARIVGEIAAAGITVDALVNNAGYGVPGKFTDTPWEAQRDMLQVMVMAVAELTHRLLPGMIQRRYGRIINIGSVAGLVPQSAGHALYGSSKALVTGFSQSIALEWMPHNVYATAVCPGFTYTEFHDVNHMREQVSRLPKFMWMDADTVAREAFEAVMAGRILHVPGRFYRMVVFLARYTPRWLVLAVVKRVSKTYRRT
ncbi:MAG TPA: SDR family oxidoreductase [Vicinamibacterales bacterium]|nr:SDR family oxidoreductase [Vicinamibacterales bacterium]HOQ59153.1 SDR family oxidoreductase [Vicinamibacterales bacterium]